MLPPDEPREQGVEERQANGLIGSGEFAGVGFKLGAVELLLVGEEDIEAEGAMGCGLVVDDPEVGDALRERLWTREEGAVDAGAPAGVLPGDEGCLRGGLRVGREKPLADGVGEGGGEGAEDGGGEALDLGRGEAARAKDGGDAWGPGGKFGEQSGGPGARRVAGSSGCI